MPIYEFRCVQCGHIFEKLFMQSNENAQLSCPKCASTSCDRVVSRTNYAMGMGKEGKQPKLTTKSCGPSNQCFTLDLPGHSRDD